MCEERKEAWGVGVDAPARPSFTALLLKHRLFFRACTGAGGAPLSLITPQKRKIVMKWCKGWDHIATYLCQVGTGMQMDRSSPTQLRRTAPPLQRPPAPPRPLTRGQDLLVALLQHRGDVDEQRGAQPVVAQQPAHSRHPAAAGAALERKRGGGAARRRFGL